MSVMTEVGAAVEAEAPKLEVLAVEVLESIATKVLGGDELHKFYAFLARVRDELGGSDTELADEIDSRGGPAAAPVAAEVRTSDVPAGAMPLVLEWVGEDRERALVALEVEYAAKRPRGELVDKLTAIADA